MLKAKLKEKVVILLIKYVPVHNRIIIYTQVVRIGFKRI